MGVVALAACASGGEVDSMASAPDPAPSLIELPTHSDEADGDATDAQVAGTLAGGQRT